MTDMSDVELSPCMHFINTVAEITTGIILFSMSL